MKEPGCISLAVVLPSVVDSEAKGGISHLAGGGPILIAGGLILIAIGGAIIWHAQRTPKLARAGTRRDESRALREIVHSLLKEALISVGIPRDTIRGLPAEGST